MNLNHSNYLKIDFAVMLNNKEFDNDDNPYGSFVFHMYTNMDNLTDNSQEEVVDGYAFEDRIIPLVICPDHQDLVWRSSEIK